jgi:hypothetical protein
MPITFYDDCESLQTPSGLNGVDGLSSVSQVKDFVTTIPQIDPSNLYLSGIVYASAVGAYGVEWLQVGVFFTLPQYGTFEVVQIGTATPTETIIFYKNRGASGNAPQGTTVPAGTLIIPAGAPGANGAPGSAIINGSGAPSSGLGSNGDFYLDTATNEIYGPKTSGSWGAGVSLVGPQGPPGTGTAIIQSSGAGPVRTGATGAFSLRSSAISVAANQLCPTNGSAAIFHAVLSAWEPAQTGSAARLKFSFRINGNVASNNPDTTTDPTNPLFSSVPSVVGALATTISYFKLEVRIQRVTQTSAIVTVTFINNFQASARVYSADVSSVVFDFAAATTLEPYVEFVSSAPFNQPIRASIVNSWIELFTQ